MSVVKKWHRWHGCNSTNPIEKYFFFLIIKNNILKFLYQFIPWHLDCYDACSYVMSTTIFFCLFKIFFVILCTYFLRLKFCRKVDKYNENLMRAVKTYWNQSLKIKNMKICCYRYYYEIYIHLLKKKKGML